MRTTGIQFGSSNGSVCPETILHLLNRKNREEILNASPHGCSATGWSLHTLLVIPRIFVHHDAKHSARVPLRWNGRFRLGTLLKAELGTHKMQVPLVAPGSVTH